MADPQADKDKKISRDALLRLSSNKDLVDALNAMERRLSRLEEAAAAKPLPGDWATSKIASLGSDKTTEITRSDLKDAICRAGVGDPLSVDKNVDLLSKYLGLKPA